MARKGFKPCLHGRLPLFGVGVENWVECNDQLIWKKCNITSVTVDVEVSTRVIRPYSIGNWSRKERFVNVSLTK